MKLKDTNSGYVKFGSNSIVTQDNFLNDISGIGTGISFSCWFASYNSGNRATIFNFGQNDNSFNNLIKVCISNNNIGAIIYRPNGSANSQLSTSGTNYNDGVMRHLVWTLDFPNTGINSNPRSTWIIYVNNSNVVSSTNNSYFPSNTNISRTSCYLGKSNVYSTDPSFNGYIDDFRIYKRVLSSTDISSIYHYKSNTINTLFAKSSLLSWTPPVRYPNASYNYYYADNSLNITYNSINISPSNNTTIPNLDPENGLTYYVKSIVGNRPTSYISF